MKPTLKDLIDAGLVSPGPRVLTMSYKDVTVHINLGEDGRLIWNDETYPNPSNFSLKFKRCINPHIQSDNGFQSILYGGETLNHYVNLFKVQMEIEILKKELQLFCRIHDLETEPEPEPEPEPELITKYFDGRSTRPLCRHSYNANRSKYGIPCSEHVSDCRCPIHRSKTFWRRLTNEALNLRKKSIVNNSVYSKLIVGLPIHEYHTFLENRFRQTFRGILPQEVLDKKYHQLCEDNYVLDEWYPRCEGKHLKDPNEIARFLAKVFNHQNTQLILHNNEHARQFGVDIDQHQMLINGSKVGIVEESAKKNFDKIVPSEEAISYMLDFVNNFIEKEA
jgi:hypothetical protein